MLAARSFGSVAVAAGDFTDPHHERIIWMVAGGLALLGVIMTITTVVWWRGARSEHPALGPLEVMGERGWKGSSSSERRRRLESVRLHPLTPPVRRDEVDLSALMRALPPNFDDLLDDRLAPHVDAPAVVADPERASDDPAPAEPVTDESPTSAAADQADSSESGGEQPVKAAAQPAEEVAEEPMTVVVDDDVDPALPSAQPNH